MADIDEFLAARDFLMRHRDDYATAYGSLSLAGVDAVQLGARLLPIAMAENSETRTALWIVDDAGAENGCTFADLTRRSNQRCQSSAPPRRPAWRQILLMLGNVVPLWETMLAAMQAGRGSGGPPYVTGKT